MSHLLIRARRQTTVVGDEAVGEEQCGDLPLSPSKQKRQERSGCADPGVGHTKVTEMVE